jgi:hypothetical protein
LCSSTQRTPRGGAPKLFDELVKGWRGFTLTGEEADEGSNELKRNPKLLNPKSYISLSKTT